MHQIVDYGRMSQFDLTAEYEGNAAKLHPRGRVNPLRRGAMIDALHLMTSLDVLPPGEDALFASTGFEGTPSGMELVYLCRPYTDPRVAFYLHLHRSPVRGSMWTTGVYLTSSSRFTVSDDLPPEYIAECSYSTIIASESGAGVTATMLMPAKVRAVLSTNGLVPLLVERVRRFA